jgi:putative endonuclease
MTSVGPRGRSAGERRRADARGRFAERLAEASLLLRGFAILARRTQTPAGEIDLVARRGGLLAIVEVKARPSLAAGVEAVTPADRRRIARAAAAFVATRPGLQRMRVRFDIIVVRPWAWPRHFPDAWRADDPGLPRGRRP